MAPAAPPSAGAFGEAPTPWRRSGPSAPLSSMVCPPRTPSPTTGLRIERFCAVNLTMALPRRRLLAPALGLILLPGMASGLADAGARGPDVTDGKASEVAPVVTPQTEAFPLSNVRLLAGPFRHAMDLDHAYLLSLEPDRLLHSFRLNAGLPSVAKPYGGWMTPGRTGCAEFVGHYLSACALMYASTGDERLRENANQVVAGLGQCQDKLGTGYLHTKPDNFTTRGEAPAGVVVPNPQAHGRTAGCVCLLRQRASPRNRPQARRLGQAPVPTNSATSECRRCSQSNTAESTRPSPTFMRLPGKRGISSSRCDSTIWR